MSVEAVHPAAGLSQPHWGWLGRHWRWVFPVALAVATLLAIGLYLAVRPRSKLNPFRFETAAVSRGPIQARVTASGTLSALVTVQVGSQISGRIQWLGADFNTVVHEGRWSPASTHRCIRPRWSRRAPSSSRHRPTISWRRHSWSNAQSPDRAQQGTSTAEPGGPVGARRQRDGAPGGAKLRCRAAMGQEADARATLHQAEINLAYTHHRRSHRRVGHLPQRGRRPDGGRHASVADAVPHRPGPAQDAGGHQRGRGGRGPARRGMTATFTVDAYPAETFTGTIREIRNAPQTVQNVVTYDAVIDVDNPDLKLKPGMTANVDRRLRRPGRRPPRPQRGAALPGPAGADDPERRRAPALQADATARLGAARRRGPRRSRSGWASPTARSPRSWRASLEAGDPSVTEAVAPSEAAGRAAMGESSRRPGWTTLIELERRHQDLPDGRRRGARAPATSASRLPRASSSRSWGRPARASRR